MNAKRNRLNVLWTLLILGICACGASKKQEDLAEVCCRECLEAFSQSPVGVGAAGAACGEFTTASPLSDRCRAYFRQHPQSVAECR